MTTQDVINLNEVVAEQWQEAVTLPLPFYPVRLVFFLYKNLAQADV